MKKPTLDKLVRTLVALGVPGLILVVAVSVSGLSGGAAIVAALAMLGGPLGMVGGIAALGAIVLISDALADDGFELLFRRVLKGLRKKGKSKGSILRTIHSLPISHRLRSKGRKYVERYWDDDH